MNSLVNVLMSAKEFISML